MSAPDTNLETQRKRHRGLIIGITAALVFVVILALGAFLRPGIPLDQQAAPDRVPSQMGTGAPPITVDNEANVIAE